MVLDVEVGWADEGAILRLDCGGLVLGFDMVRGVKVPF